MAGQVKPSMWCPGIVPVGHPLRDGLLLWSPMWDGPGSRNAMDVSGNGHHFVFAATSELDTDWPTTDIGYVTKYDDGGDDWMQSTLPSHFNSIAANSASVMLWFRGSIPGAATFKRLMDLRFDASNYIQFVGTLSYSDAIQFGVVDAGTTRMVRSTPLSTTEWHCVVGLWDAPNNTVSLYVDGIKHATASEGGIGAGTVQAITLGIRSDHNSATQWEGEIAAFGAWDHLISPGAIEWLYRDAWVLSKMDDDMPWITAAAASGAAVAAGNRRRRFFMGAA